MPLDFSALDSFLRENSEVLKDKTLVRHERYRILAALNKELEGVLRTYKAFEAEFRTLIKEKIETAPGFGELHHLHESAMKGIESYFLEEDNVVDVHDLFRIVRDSITIRTLALVEDEMEREGYGRPPSAYTWIGLGSEGRDEQTLVTDQDNLIIYDEGCDPDLFSEYLLDKCYEHQREAGLEDGFGKITPKHVIDFYFKVFSETTVERLHEVGFEKCTGNVMPSNVKWRGSLSDWKERLEQRLTFERGVFEALDVVILTDARFISGDKRMIETLLAGFFQLLTDNRHVMKDFIQAAVLMPTALSFFGNFKVEKSGDHKDMLNIKLHGWAPLILAVRMLALSNGIFEPNTLKRIRALRVMNVIKKDMENDLTDAYLIFVKFRIMNQIQSGKVENHMDLSYLKPDMLGGQDRDRLRKAMRSVEALQKYIQTVLLFGQAV